MPDYRVEVIVVAKEYWLTTVSAASQSEAVDIVRMEAKRNFQPETFEIDLYDIREI